MKKSIKQTKKQAIYQPKKIQDRLLQKKGYKEDVYNGEEQSSYNKSNLAKNNKKNTAGPNN